MGRGKSTRVRGPGGSTVLKGPRGSDPLAPAPVATASATCYFWDHRKELFDLVDVWEAANCDDRWPATKDALRQNVDVALTLYRNGSWAA